MDRKQSNDTTNLLSGFPEIVCLCGSTRFWRVFQEANLRLTMEGKIVLSIGCATNTDDGHFGNLPREQYDAIKANLDTLHLRKIDLCDSVLILNVGDYIGESTSKELAYARWLDKKVCWLYPSRHALDREGVSEFGESIVVKETPTDAEIAKKVVTDLIARLEKRVSENEHELNAYGGNARAEIAALRRMLTALNTNQNP